MTVPITLRLARTAGGLLATPFSLVAAARRGRALHPEGVTLHGHLRIADDPLAPGTGYDGPALVRLSRSAGLPPGAPDVHGVAVRWVVDGAPHDLLLASAGTGVPGRFLLTVRRTPWTGAFSTLMPFSGPRGPFVLAAVPRPHAAGDTRAPRPRVDLTLLAATPTGRWRRCGALVASERTDDDPRFDPVRNPAYAAYPWAAALRAPSYAAARRHGRPATR